MLACRVFGHRYRFSADGSTMRWQCERGCAAGGAKGYPSADAAQRYAAALDRRENAEIGKRAPFLGMFPLRIWHAIRRRSRHR